MKKVYLSALASLALIMSSCAAIPTPAGLGVLYTSVDAPETVTSNTLGKKVGTASASNILGLVTMGDVSVQTVAKNAGIKKISHIDAKRTSILGVYGTYTINVYGD